MERQTTPAKALRVNLDLQRYGAFAEIGAGQEVARHFFQAGKASQTIAKSMSAYDMAYSDEIYGKEKNGRYVCESRLEKMLEKEFSLLLRRLDEKRGDSTAFFAMANTVATGTPETPRCHGWMGVRFQTKPKGEFNDIILHVRMIDRHRLQQQEALGILGVNLVEAAFYGLDDPDEFIPRLVENLKKDQVFIDTLRFAGPDLKKFDNRKINLDLVRRGLAEAVLFSPQGEILHLSDEFYSKALVIERGTFRPLTATHVDVLEKGAAQLHAEIQNSAQPKTEILKVMEIVMPQNIEAQKLQEFSDRIDVIGAAGFHTLISNFPLFYQLKVFIRKSTPAPIAIVIGASKLEALFDEVHYKNLEGGLVEGLAKMFGDRTELYVYPHKTDLTCLTAKLFRPKGPVEFIYNFYLQRKQIADISGCDQTGNYWHSADVRQRMEAGNSEWQKMVPAKALDVIRRIYKV